MIEAITKERWDEAQVAEFAEHANARPTNQWRDAALRHFCHIDRDQQGKTIVEVGAGPAPVLAGCENVHAILIEPLSYPSLLALKGRAGFDLLIEPAERALEFTMVYNAQEAWLFNVLQHVADPELVVEKCKHLSGGVVRFFEPINCPTCVYHPHTFSFSDFQRWFGESAKLYDHDYWPGFHDSPCAYGVWRREK